MASADAPARGAGLPPDEALVAGLRAGDEPTFARVVDAWSAGMLRAARGYVTGAEAAQDVVQDTWLAVIRGIDRFEARSSLRTWVYRILVNVAKTRGVRDSRTVPLSALAPTDSDHGPTVDLGVNWGKAKQDAVERLKQRNVNSESFAVAGEFVKAVYRH